MNTITVKDYQGPNYRQVHAWLHKLYGSASHCESLECRKISTRFEWALKPNCTYSKTRENFHQLCTRCHCKQDRITHKRVVQMEKIRSHFKEIATQTIRIYPSDYQHLLNKAELRHTCMAQIIKEILDIA